MLEAFGLSDSGCVRPNNEDYFITDTQAGIFILADGMGGANAGEYASRFSAEMLYDFLLKNSSTESLGSLERGFVEVNSAIRQAAERDPALEGMGTTLLAARAVNGLTLQLGSVGDSRAYMLSGSDFALITQDQTWVAEVGSRLGLSDESLKNHPMRHVLTMAVGAAEELRVYSKVISMKPGDQLLLCSDGLHGVVDEKILYAALESKKTLPAKCHYLIEAAKKTGGPDNITVVLIQSV